MQHGPTSVEPYVARIVAPLAAPCRIVDKDLREAIRAAQMVLPSSCGRTSRGWPNRERPHGRAHKSKNRASFLLKYIFDVALEDPILLLHELLQRNALHSKALTDIGNFSAIWLCLFYRDDGAPLDSRACDHERISVLAALE